MLPGLLLLLLDLDAVARCSLVPGLLLRLFVLDTVARRSLASGLLLLLDCGFFLVLVDLLSTLQLGIIGWFGDLHSSARNTQFAQYSTLKLRV